MNRFLSRIRRKLANINGETLVETLVSTLIIAGVMLMLCTAIVAAARVNTTIQSEDTTFNVQGTETAPKTKLSGDLKLLVNGRDCSGMVDAYVQNGYVFYAPTGSTGTGTEE